MSIFMLFVFLLKYNFEPWHWQHSIIARHIYFERAILRVVLGDATIFSL